MTINHVFVWASMAKAQSLQSFYRTILKPIGYSELIRVNDGNLVGYGSDYPYLWLKTLPADKSSLSTHIAFDAPSNEAVDEFYRLALEHGGRDNGGPGIRKEMSRQPYYSAFIIDLDGNNIEAVCVRK